MTIDAIPPGLVLIAGGLLLPLLAPGKRVFVTLLLPLFVLWLVWQVPDGVSWSANFMGYDIEPLRGDRLSRLFATVFAIMSFTGSLFAFRHARLVEMCSAFVYGGGAIGVVLGGLATWGVAEFAGWQVALGVNAVLLAVGFSAAVGVFFGFYPARRAAAPIFLPRGWVLSLE